MAGGNPSGNPKGVDISNRCPRRVYLYKQGLTWTLPDRYGEGSIPVDVELGFPTAVGAFPAWGKPQAGVNLQASWWASWRSGKYPKDKEIF